MYHFKSYDGKVEIKVSFQLSNQNISNRRKIPQQDIDTQGHGEEEGLPALPAPFQEPCPVSASGSGRVSICALPPFNRQQGVSPNSHCFMPCLKSLDVMPCQLLKRFQEHSSFRQRGKPVIPKWVMGSLKQDESRESSFWPETHLHFQAQLWVIDRWQRET